MSPHIIVTVPKKMALQITFQNTTGPKEYQFPQDKTLPSKISRNTKNKPKFGK